MAESAENTWWTEWGRSENCAGVSDKKTVLKWSLERRFGKRVSERRFEEWSSERRFGKRVPERRFGKELLYEFNELAQLLSVNWATSAQLRVDEQQNPVLATPGWKEVSSMRQPETPKWVTVLCVIGLVLMFALVAYIEHLPMPPQ